MVEMLAGALLGIITSLVITHIYYRRSTRDFQEQVDALRTEINRLAAMSKELQESADAIQDDTITMKRHVARGTPDDPGYPYK